MRLEFKVLWFENQMDDVKQAAVSLKRELAKHGLQLDLNEQRDATNLESLAKHQELYHDFDLVVVDWDLGGGQPTGDQVAKRIRLSFGFTDIIFYSGNATERLRDFVKDQAIDGVYCCGRRELRQKLIEHAEYVVERLSRLEAMRGLAVVSASRGDECMRQLLRAAYARMTPEAGKELIRIIDDYVGKSIDKSREEYSKIADIDGKIASRALTSIILFKASKYAIEVLSREMPECAKHLEIMKEYLVEVIQPRNLLGHVVETREDAGWVVQGKSGQKITKKDLSDIRKHLRTHLENFAALSACLVVAEEAKENLADSLS